MSTYHSRARVQATDNDKKPDIIKFYNETKGGVDVLDKLVGTYRSKRKVNRWPVALFTNMLDVSGCNAFIVFTALNPSWNISKKAQRRRLFLVELGESLCLPFIEQRRTMPRGAHAIAMVNTLRNSPDIFGETSTATTEANQSSFSMQHAPQIRKRATCSYCKRSQSRNVHSKRCDNCLNHVCPQHSFFFCVKCAKCAKSVTFK